MKKILLILVLLAGCAGFALENIVPSRVNSMSLETIGVYQPSGAVTIYKKPNAQVIRTIDWNNFSSDMFVIYIPSKGLAFLAVEDEIEGWFEVVYDNLTGEKGWIKKDDPNKFISWLTFYNIYGKKYGLNLLSGVPDAVKNLYSAPDEFSQVTGRINQPQKINLTVIRGNWALVSVYDLDKVPKTGYIRWRADNGVKYLFPAIE
jgi:hypothetical protein